MEFNVDKIFEAIEIVAKQNLLTSVETQHIFEESVKKAFHTKFDPDAELELLMDKETRIFKLINHSKLVIDDKAFNADYRLLEIPLSEAKKIDPKAKVGSNVSEEIDFKQYASELLQSIKQIFIQQVREKKKEAIYAKHKALKGEMIDVTVVSVTHNYSIFTLDDGTTAFMPANLRNPKIKLGAGQRTKVFVEDVLEESRDAQIIVSNGSKEVVKRVLEVEVPEIASGLVVIESIARMPGLRSKVAVKSTDPNIDPVGTIIGAKGSRINSIVEKLDGEKLDVIPWSENTDMYIANSLSPAKVISVIDNPAQNKNGKLIITPNKHQTLAIGKQGSNVKLAVELTGVKIDVISISEAEEKGIEIIWNTGLTKEQVKDIEEGKKITVNRNATKSHVNFNDFMFENEIESFTNEMEEEKAIDNSFEDFQIDDELFSDEAIKDMEADFEYDEELENYEEDEDGEELQ